MNTSAEKKHGSGQSEEGDTLFNDSVYFVQ